MSVLQSSGILLVNVANVWSHEHLSGKDLVCYCRLFGLGLELDQNRNSLLVKQQNDNTSPGPLAEED